MQEPLMPSAGITGESRRKSLAELEPQPGEDRPSTPSLGQFWLEGEFSAQPKVVLHRRPTGGHLRSQSEDYHRTHFAISRRTSSAIAGLNRQPEVDNMLKEEDLNQPTQSEGFFIPAQDDQSPHESFHPELDQIDPHPSPYFESYYDVLRELQSTDRKVAALRQSTQSSLP